MDFEGSLAVCGLDLLLSGLKGEAKQFVRIHFLFRRHILVYFAKMSDEWGKEEGVGG